MERVNQTARSKKRGGVNATTLSLLILLLILPSIAISRLSGWMDWRVLVGVPFALSLFSFLSYRSDKRRAEAGAWRIPESTLHLADIIGGWPGAFLAHRIFRHKISKRSFQFFFWLIVLIHQFLATDFLLDWQFTQQVIRCITT